MESAMAPNEVDETMALEDLNLNKVDEDDTDLLLQVIYLEDWPIFLLAQLGMELVFETGRHLEKPDLVKLLLTNRTVSCHLVVCLKLLQLRCEKKILRWTLGQ